MSDRFRHIFETAAGWCGIAWGPAGVTGFVLPMRDPAAVENRLASKGGDTTPVDAPRGDAALWVAAVRRYYDGEAAEFDDVAVDLSALDAFDRDILEAARRLAHGETTTYGELSARAGHPGKARETGAALGRNPVPLIVPCHRILAAGNRIGGFSAPGGSTTKERMLALEGVRLGPPPSAQASFGF